MKLILASGSAARRAMLEAAGVQFEIARPDFNEDQVKTGLMAAGLGPLRIAEELAKAKALGVAGSADRLILGADQTLEIRGGAMLGKPETREEARNQLRMLSGSEHKLHSAAAVTENGVAIWACAETAVLKMRPISDDFLAAYLDREFESIRHSAGGYHIEGLGAQLFEQVEGSHFAIVGLPLLPLLRFLRERGLLLQ